MLLSSNVYLTPTRPRSVEREIREGVSGLNICGEWEKKIMTTQGKIPKLSSFKEAFTLHPECSPYFGTHFKWEVDALEARASRGLGKSLFRETVRTPQKGGGQGGHLYTKQGESVKPVVPVPRLNMEQVAGNDV